MIRHANAHLRATLLQQPDQQTTLRPDSMPARRETAPRMADRSRCRQAPATRTLIPAASLAQLPPAPAHLTPRPPVRVQNRISAFAALLLSLRHQPQPRSSRTHHARLLAATLPS